MALGSWQGLYNTLIDDLMDERREQEMLLLMAIARYVDPLGFCFPGRAKLMAKRHITQPVYERRLAFLEERKLVRVEEGYDYRRRQKQFDFQVSPRAIYVRGEFQEYCERVFDGLEERNLALEKWLLENHFSTNDSLPESLPESETDAVTQTQEPASLPRHHNQRGKTRPEQSNARKSTTGNARQTPAGKQPPAGNATAHRKTTAHAGPDEFAALLSPTVDDDRIIAEIQHVAMTTEHQAREIVATYPRPNIVFWLEKTARRRAKGELKKPGGWFFAMLRSQTAFPESHWPDWAREQKAATDSDSDLSELAI